MESAWRLSWRPTLYLKDIESKFREYVDSHTEFNDVDVCLQKVLEMDVQNYTVSLQARPYRPWIWLGRGKTLLRLRYPELAAGDAYKAWLLITKSRSQSYQYASDVRHELATKLRRYSNPFGLQQCEALATEASVSEIQRQLDHLEAQAVLLLGQALFFANSFAECLEVTEDAKSYENRKDLKRLRRLVKKAYSEEWNFHLQAGMTEMRPSDILDKMKYGTILAQPYPWLKADMMCRTSSTISLIRQSLEAKSGQRCTLRTSKLIKNIRQLRDESGHSFQVLGIFAKQDLNGGDKVLVDRTALSAADPQERRCSCCCGPVSASSAVEPCCLRDFCSERCLVRANKFYHQEQHMCFDRSESEYDAEKIGLHLWKKGPGPKNETLDSEEVAERRLLLRVLTGAVVACSRLQVHPLNTPVLSRLTSVYGSSDEILFSLEKDVIQPNMMLEKLDIDIFANHNFDTWVVQTIQNRMRANSWEHETDEVHFLAISPLYSFFNHSCEPNVEWGKDETNTTLTMRTTRDVDAGEELFISYLDDDDLLLPAEERQEKMSSWTDHCQCVRCARERKTNIDDSWTCQTFVQTRRPGGTK